MKPIRSSPRSALWIVLALFQGCTGPYSTIPDGKITPVSDSSKPAWLELLKQPVSDSKIVQTSANAPDEKPADLPEMSPLLTREAVMAQALKTNPQLVVFREARGMATAGVVLAKIYPYNPVFQSHQLYVNGPISAGITSHYYTENYAILPLELRGQGRERVASALATVTRTEWEIAGQELLTAISILRAYDTVLYREQKLRVLVETVTLSEQVLKQSRQLADAGKLGAADVLFASTELDAARAAVGQGKTAVAVAKADLQRQLGTMEIPVTVSGELDLPLPDFDEKALTPFALKHRPEIYARRAAIEEADTQLRLQIADRYNNLAIGPRVDYSETRANFLGIVIGGFIPAFNTRQGEIAQRRAALSRANVDLHATEFLVQQSVDAALSRFHEAKKWAKDYSQTVIPNLKQARKDIEKLFIQNEQGVDLLRVLGVQRNLLRSEDAYLDAQFEVSQARLDVAAAVGEPGLALGAFHPDEDKAGPCGPSVPCAVEPKPISRWIRSGAP
jgi:outer membrane protein TolC